MRSVNGKFMTQQPARICILGGGFGGLYTALRLSQFSWKGVPKPDITLIDQGDRFLFSPFLYEVVSGELQTWEVAPLFQDLLAGTGVKFHQAKVADVNVEQKSVVLKDGETQFYDYLVLAIGGETPLGRVPGSQEYALPFRTVADAYRLKDRLQALQEQDAEKIRIAIVGAGYSGVELACKLADLLAAKGRIRLIDLGDRILRNSPEFNRTAAQKALGDRGVWVDLETSVAEITADTISLTYKGVTDTIPVDLVLWTVGTRVSAVVTGLPLKQNESGQIVTTPTLQVVEHPEIFALGDLADCKDAEGQQVPTTAQAAIQQADYVGWNLWATISQRPLLPYRYQHLGEMLTLGQDNATLTALGIKLDGAPATLFRKLAYLYRMPTAEHQLRVGLSWMVQPIYSLLAALNA